MYSQHVFTESWFGVKTVNTSWRLRVFNRQELVSIGVVQRARRPAISCHRGFSCTGDVTCSVVVRFWSRTTHQRLGTRSINEGTYTRSATTGQVQRDGSGAA